MELSMFDHLLTHFNFAAYDMSGLAYVSDYDYFLVIVSYLIAVMTGYAGLNFSHLVNCLFCGFGVPKRTQFVNTGIFSSRKSSG